MHLYFTIFVFIGRGIPNAMDGSAQGAKADGDGSGLRAPSLRFPCAFLRTLHSDSSDNIDAESRRRRLHQAADSRMRHEPSFYGRRVSSAPEPTENAREMATRRWSILTRDSTVPPPPHKLTEQQYWPFWTPSQVNPPGVGVGGVGVGPASSAEDEGARG